MAAYHSPLRSKNSALRTNPTGRRSQRTGRTSFLNSAGIRTPPSSNLICFPLSPQTGSTRLLTCLHFLFFWYLAIKLFAITHGSSDRKSTRLNSSHDQISYAVFCLKKKIICDEPRDLTGSEALCDDFA